MMITNLLKAGFAIVLLQAMEPQKRCGYDCTQKSEAVAGTLGNGERKGSCGALSYISQGRAWGWASCFSRERSSETWKVMATLSIRTVPGAAPRRGFT